jgi:hypothetical protein
MVDVVLNHTSVDSSWLARHPEAGYSLRNSSHLRAAFELDEAMLRVSGAIAAGRVPGVAAAMHSAAAVGAACNAVLNAPGAGIVAARLWELYVLDIGGTLAAAAAVVPGLLPGGCAGALSDAAAALRAGEDDGAGDGGAGAPLPPPFTPGVPPAELSSSRRFEIAASRHATVRAVLDALGAWEGDARLMLRCARATAAAAVTDAQLAAVAASLMRQPPPAPVDVALARLTAGSAHLWRTAAEAAGGGGAARGGGVGGIAPTATHADVLRGGGDGAHPTLVTHASFFVRNEGGSEGGGGGGARTHGPPPPPPPRPRTRCWGGAVAARTRLPVAPTARGVTAAAAPRGGRSRACSTTARARAFPCT